MTKRSGTQRRLRNALRLDLLALGWVRVFHRHV